MSFVLLRVCFAVGGLPESTLMKKVESTPCISHSESGNKGITSNLPAGESDNLGNISAFAEPVNKNRPSCLYSSTDCLIDKNNAGTRYKWIASVAFGSLAMTGPGHRHCERSDAIHAPVIASAATQSMPIIQESLTLTKHP